MLLLGCTIATTLYWFKPKPEIRTLSGTQASFGISDSGDLTTSPDTSEDTGHYYSQPVY